MVIDTVAAMALAPCRHLPLAHAARHRGPWSMRMLPMPLTCSSSHPRSIPPLISRINGVLLSPELSLFAAARLRLSPPTGVASRGSTSTASSATASSCSLSQELDREGRSRRNHPRQRQPRPPVARSKYWPNSGVLGSPSPLWPYRSTQGELRPFWPSPAPSLSLSRCRSPPVTVGVAVPVTPAWAPAWPAWGPLGSGTWPA